VLPLFIKMMIGGKEENGYNEILRFAQNDNWAGMTKFILHK
jgi:hypothetical protein